MGNFSTRFISKLQKLHDLQKNVLVKSCLCPGLPSAGSLGAASGSDCPDGLHLHHPHHRPGEAQLRRQVSVERETRKYSNLVVICHWPSLIKCLSFHELLIHFHSLLFNRHALILTSLDPLAIILPSVSVFQKYIVENGLETVSNTLQQLIFTSSFRFTKNYTFMFSDGLVRRLKLEG